MLQLLSLYALKVLSTPTVSPVTSAVTPDMADEQVPASGAVRLLYQFPVYPPMVSVAPAAVMWDAENWMFSVVNSAWDALLVISLAQAPSLYALKVYGVLGVSPARSTVEVPPAISSEHCPAGVAGAVYL